MVASLGHVSVLGCGRAHSSAFRRPSSSACTPGLTSRLRRICSAPLTASAGDLLAQRLARLHRFLLGLGPGGGDDLGASSRGAALGFLDHLLRQALGIGQALGGVVARGGQLLLDALVGVGQLGLGLVGGRQAVGDLLGALVERRR